MGSFAGIFVGIMSLLNLEIRPKLNLLLKQFVSTTADKQLNRISCNFEYFKWINCVHVHVYWQFLFDFFLRELRFYRAKIPGTLFCANCETNSAFGMNLNDREAVWICF